MLEISPKIDGDTEPGARFRFESGPLAGSDFIGTARACDQPSCMCDLIHFKLAQSTESDMVVNFALEVRGRRVDDRGATGGKDLSFARNLARSLTEEEWLDLLVAYTKAKEAVTETADIQKIQAYFPDDGDSTIFWYRGVLPHAAPFRFLIDGERVDAFDSYCASPECPCTEAFLTFVRPGTDHRGLPDDYSEVRLSYRDRALVAVVREAKRETTKSQALVDALVRDIPAVWQKLSTRHENIKALYCRFRTEEDARSDQLSAKRVGRNDACPCGSGKKFKKCCMRT